MSGILIQFKRRINQGSIAQYAIDQRDVAFFPPEGINRAGIDIGNLKVDPAVRPYITLVMELGVTLRGQSKSTDRYAVKKMNKALRTGKPRPLRYSDAKQTTPVEEPTDSPSRGILFQGVSRTSARKPNKTVQPRYSIFAYGCSHLVYKVIREEDCNMYRQLLQNGALIVQHPRPKMLPAVRSMNHSGHVEKIAMPESMILF